MHKIKVSDSINYRGTQPQGTREFSTWSSDGKGSGGLTVRYWPWIPQIEIVPTKGRIFCVEGDECIAFIEALNETLRAMVPPAKAVETPSSPVVANSEQLIMSRLLEAEIPHSRGRSACAS